MLTHICRYTGRQNSGDPVPLKLAGEADVRAGLGAIRRDLHLPDLLGGAGRSCTAVGGELVPHRVRSDYADGSVWVSAAQEPNGCTDSGNGAFTTGLQLGDRLALAFDTGRWPLAPTSERCSAGGGGQEEQLVPDGWTSMTVCHPGLNDPGPLPRLLDAATAGRVVALLEDADLAPGSGGCSGGDNTRFHLHPDDNGVLLGAAAGAVRPGVADA